MSLPDTAEYWRDVNKPRKVFTHLKDQDCGHYHKQETNNLALVDCYTCLKLIKKALKEKK